MRTQTPLCFVLHDLQNIFNSFFQALIPLYDSSFNDSLSIGCLREGINIRYEQYDQAFHHFM